MFSRWAFIFGCFSFILFTNNAGLLRAGDSKENSTGSEARNESKTSNANRPSEVLLDLTNPRVSNADQPAQEPVLLKSKPKRRGAEEDEKPRERGGTREPLLDRSRPEFRSNPHQSVNASNSIPAANSPGERIPGAWRDILEVRREDGDLYRGTVFDELGSPATEEEFLEALQAVAARRGDKSRRTNLPASLDQQSSRIRPIEVERSASTDLELAATLRLTARQLDTKAADLENERQYAEADEYRSLAHRLRTQARTLAPPIAPAAQPAGRPRKTGSHAFGQESGTALEGPSTEYEPSTCSDKASRNATTPE
ncbi:MAG: hypothetical protein ACODAD_01655 [Planctomycetota bacterium]